MQKYTLKLYLRPESGVYDAANFTSDTLARHCRCTGLRDTLCAKFVKRLRCRSVIPKVLLATISQEHFEGSRRFFVRNRNRHRWCDNYSFSHLFPTNIDDCSILSAGDLYENAYAFIEESFGKNYRGPVYFTLKKLS